MLWIRFWDHFQKKWWFVRLLEKWPFLGSNNTVRLGGYFALGWFSWFLFFTWKANILILVKNDEWKWWKWAIENGENHWMKNRNITEWKIEKSLNESLLIRYLKYASKIGQKRHMAPGGSGFVPNRFLGEKW